jgi:hypothetical protein
MREWQHTQTEEVASGRLATSSQPPPHPIRLTVLLDNPDTILQGLRRSPTHYPLPSPTHDQGVAMSRFPLTSRAVK